jgi:hypothetical protein
MYGNDKTENRAQLRDLWWLLDKNRTIVSTESKKDASGYFYYNHENCDTNVVIQKAINSAGNGETIQIEAG